MMNDSNIPDLILEETRQLPDNLLKEALDFILFLKNKQDDLSNKKNLLSFLQHDEFSHLEKEFENYKILYLK